MKQSTVIHIAALLFISSTTEAYLPTNLLDQSIFAHKFSNYDITNDTTQLTDVLPRYYSDDQSSSSSDYRSEANFDADSPPSVERRTTTDNNNQTATASKEHGKSETNTSSSQNLVESTKGFSSDSIFNHTDSTSTTNEKVGNFTTVVESSSTAVSNASESTDSDDGEGVVVVKPTEHVNETTVTWKIKTLYQRTLEMISDTYTLSIVLPVAAGIVFASTIILTIYTCRCLQRRCRRNRFRRKVLPDSVKTLRPSDRARLLAESSDEEF